MRYLKLIFGLLSFVCSSAVFADLVISPDYQLVSSKRINRVVTEFTYRISVTNTSPLNLSSASATVVSSSSYTSVTDGEVEFGPVAAGATTSSLDTFTISHDRRSIFDPNSLTWSPKSKVKVSGYVVDDPVAGATVNLMNAQGEVLGEAISDANGFYSLEIDPNLLSGGFIAKASGGEINGSPFFEEMYAQYGLNDQLDDANITLITSLVHVFSNDSTGTIMEKRDNAISQLSAFNLVNQQTWNDLEPSTVNLNSFRQGVNEKGLVGYLDIIVNDVGFGVPSYHLNSVFPQNNLSYSSSKPIYTKVLTGAPDDITDIGGGIEIHVPEGVVLPNTKLEVWHTVLNQDSAMERLSIKLDQLILKDHLDINLPQNHLLDPTNVNDKDTLCADKDDDVVVEKNYYVNTLVRTYQDYFYSDTVSRVSKNDAGLTEAVLTTGDSVNGAAQQFLVLDRKISAILCSSSQSQSSSTQNIEPILLIHGFTLGDNIGGGSNTWGYLPEITSNVLSAGGRTPVIYEFRWRTDTRFQEAADELAEAINWISNETGSDVHLVAHSFGGVLARTLLQGLASTNERLPVRSLTTVGTPHSGVFADEEDVFPKGADNSITGYGIKGCGQITCYQSGQSLSTPSSIRYPSILKGEIVKSIAGNSAFRVSDLPLQSLIGLRSDGYWSSFLPPVFYQNNKYDSGDGLISFEGQRFLPSYRSSEPYARNKEFNGAIVSEYVLELLGFEELTINKVAPSLDFFFNSFDGYSHTKLHRAPTFGKADRSEVYIDSVSDTDHPTIKYIERFILENTSNSTIVDDREILVEGILNSITLGGQFGQDLVNDRYFTDGLWTFDRHRSCSVFRFKQPTSNESIKFGMYDPFILPNESKIELFNSETGNQPVTKVCIGYNGFIDVEYEIYTKDEDFVDLVLSGGKYFTSSMFGFYLETPTGIHYSQPYLNGGTTNGIFEYKGDGNSLINVDSTGYQSFTTSQFLIAWLESKGGSSSGYSDLIVTVDSAIPIGEDRYQYVGQNGEIVFDSITGLEWSRCSVGQTWDGSTCTGLAEPYNWYDAHVVAENATYGGYSDWRLPTIDELFSLVYCSSGTTTKWNVGDAHAEFLSNDCGEQNGMKIYEAAFPNTAYRAPSGDTAESMYWSSTALDHSWAFVVVFSMGNPTIHPKDWSSVQRVPFQKVRLVRNR